MKRGSQAGIARLLPRREPQQARSRHIVERILSASRALINESGSHEFTTNHIAERAGLSIGSVYRYFPSKVAILSALAEDLMAAIQRDVVTAVSDSPSDESFEELCSRVILRFVRLIRREQRLIAAISDRVDELSSIGMIDHPEIAISGAIVHVVRRARGALRHDETSAAFALATSTIAHLTREYVVNRRPPVDEETFAGLLSDLITRFLHDGVGQSATKAGSAPTS